MGQEQLFSGCFGATLLAGELPAVGDKAGEDWRSLPASPGAQGLGRGHQVPERGAKMDEVSHALPCDVDPWTCPAQSSTAGDTRRDCRLCPFPKSSQVHCPGGRRSGKCLAPREAWIREVAEGCWCFSPRTRAKQKGLFLGRCSRVDFSAVPPASGSAGPPQPGVLGAAGWLPWGLELTRSFVPFSVKGEAPLGWDFPVFCHLPRGLQRQEPLLACWGAALPAQGTCSWPPLLSCRTLAPAPEQRLGLKSGLFTKYH